MVNIAINGFGRIGRMVFRAGFEDKKINFVAFNDLTDTKILANLLKFDSVHGKFDGKVDFTDDSLIIDGKEIKVYGEKDPENLPWSKHDVDVVVESTGFFRTSELAGKHTKAGAKKVIISAPAKGDDVKHVVVGVNDNILEKDDNIISNASCTTNCLAPVAKVLNDNFGINSGFMTTVHGYTSTQNLIDGPNKDLRRSRAAAVNVIPTTTGAAKTTEKVLPELKGKLNGYALRVPIPNGSVTDFGCQVKKNVSIEDVNKAFKKASSSNLKGILEYSENPLVSSDIIGNPHSSIFDSGLTDVLNDNFVKVVSWYDNEWGFSVRMLDLAKLMAK